MRWEIYWVSCLSFGWDSPAKPLETNKLAIKSLGSSSDEQGKEAGTTSSHSSCFPSITTISDKLPFFSPLVSSSLLLHVYRSQSPHCNHSPFIGLRKFRLTFTPATSALDQIRTRGTMAGRTWTQLPLHLNMSLLLLISVFTSTIAAQSVIDYSKLPQCAHSCTTLQSAEGSCVPPAAPVTNQATYQSCVCQSSLLTGLKSSGGICQQFGCSTDDANAISQYYISLCNGPVIEPTTTTTGTSTTATTTGTSTSTADSSSGDKGVSDANSSDNSW